VGVLESSFEACRSSLFERALPNTRLWKLVAQAISGDTRCARRGIFEE
jgi:hypothetical protein